jgi:hypothetical protein
MLALRIALAAALAACALPPPPPPAADLSLPPIARELDYLERALRSQHPDPFRHCGEQDYRAALADAAEQMSEQDAEDWHLHIRRLVALVGDAHTRVESLGPFQGSVTPFLLRPFADGWWIIGALPGFEGLVGNRVERIEDSPMDEILVALRPYVSFDNEAALAQAAPGLLRRPEFLHAIGIAGDAANLNLELVNLDGVRRGVRVPSVANDGIYLVFRIRPEDPDPWMSRQPERIYWLDFLANGDLYIRYRACHEDPAQRLADFAQETAVALRTGAPQRAIVDLRENGGGDSRIFEPVIRLFERGGPGADAELWVLTDPGTFSSGLLNAWQLRTRAGARLAGEPSAQRPNCFGEIRSFHLPVSGLKISCSTKSFRLMPGDPEQMPVDLEVPLAGADWFRGRDPVLARLLAE